jgi:hypothetical protein
MRVAAEVRRLVNEPHLQVHDENALAWIIHDFAGEKRKGALKD